MHGFAQRTELLTADQIIAGFIYNFTKYTEWPPRPQDEDLLHFHICVAGTSGVSDQLSNVVQGKLADNRSIQVRRIGEDLNVRGCEILYVGNVPRKLEERLLGAVAGQPILTVGSSTGFLRGEGLVTFVLEEDRVRFELNARAAEKVNIRFDSRILALARNRSEVAR
jgi:hypothetical protein